MIPSLPSWIGSLFLATYVLTLVIFYLANNRPRKLIAGILIWSTIHSILAYHGFYLDLSMPPRVAIILIPITVTIIYSCTSYRIQWIIENRNIKISTFLHTIRIPMEIILLYLFLNGWIPEIMSFHGKNFDIVAGILSLIVGLFYLGGIVKTKALIIFNIIGLLLILTILIIAILSTELPIQQFGLDQPNRAILYFPFILLAAVIVPIVIYTHISDLIYLIKQKGKEK